jgi:hypothetical protein
VPLAAAVLAGCAAPESLDAIARAREADRTAPVVNYPLRFAPAERVPVEAGDVTLAARGDGFFAAWIDELDAQTIPAVDVDAGGHPKGNARVLVSTPKTRELDLGNAACSPAGDCVVVALRQADTNAVAIMTSAADGTASTIEMPAGDAFVLPRVAYDGDAASFVVIWNDGGIVGVHVVAGAAIEAPFSVIGGEVSGLGVACAPGHGCLADSSGSSTTVVPISATGAGAPLTIVDWVLDNLTYAGGVYFSTVSSADSIGVLRQDIDGTALDAAPLTAAPPGTSTKLVLGAAFDSTAFDVAVDATAHTPFGAPRHTTIYRSLPDGTLASPATIDVDGFEVMPGFSCGAGVCQLATNTTAGGLPGLAVATIDEGGSVKLGGAVGAAIGGQRFVVALPIGGRVLAAWYEGPILRTRWFSSIGEADGPPRDLDETRLLVDGDANGDRGLLAFADPDDEHFVGARVVSANGDIGPFVSSAPPPEPSKEHARFGTFWDFGRFALTRWDADGNQLDAKGLSPDSVPNAVGEEMARAGDIFVLLGHGLKEGKPALRLTSVFDTGEILDVTEIDPNLLAPKSDSGLACSPDRCLLVNAPFDGQARRSGQLAFFDPSRYPLRFELSPFGSTEVDRVLFDGQHFLVFFVERGLESGSRGSTPTRTRRPGSPSKGRAWWARQRRATATSSSSRRARASSASLGASSRSSRSGASAARASPSRPGAAAAERRGSWRGGAAGGPPPPPPPPR